MQDGTRWTLIFDMQKGLEKAVGEILPEIEHRMCVRHVLANWQKKHKGVEMRKKFWAAARSTFEMKLNDNLKRLEVLDKKSVPDLIYYNIESWCRTYFKNYNQCDVVDNNMFETFNGWIFAARHKTIINMLEEIKVQVMNRIHQLRDFANTWISDISPMAMKILWITQRLQ
ncbi:hypothetical protein M5689_011192 [Euphorbia peplus]|nr:hypothetical protein M5689_011192 [Euphorbia peplus]